MLLKAQLEFNQKNHKHQQSYMPRFVQKINPIDASDLFNNKNLNITLLLSDSLEVLNQKLQLKCGKYLENCINDNKLVNLDDKEIQEIKNLVDIKKKEIGQFRFVEYEKLNAKKKDIQYDDVVSYSSTVKNQNSQIHQDLHSQVYKGNGLELKPIKKLDAGYLLGASVPKRPQPLQLKDISQMRKINSKNDFNFVRNYPSGQQFNGQLLNSDSQIKNVLTNTKDYSITEFQENIENNLGHQEFGNYRSDKFSPDGSNVIEVIQPKIRKQTETSPPLMMDSQEAAQAAKESDETLIQQSEEMMNQMQEEVKENQQLLNQESAQQQVMSAQTSIPDGYEQQGQQNNVQSKVDDQRFMKKSKSESNSQSESKNKSKHKKHHSMTEQKNLEYDIKQLKFQIKTVNQEIFKLSGTKPVENYSELEGKDEEEQIEILQSQLSTAQDQKQLLQEQKSSGDAPKPIKVIAQLGLPPNNNIAQPMSPQIQMAPQNNPQEISNPSSSDLTPEQQQDDQLDDEFQKLMELD